MKNWNIGKRIITGGTTLLLLLLSVSAVGIYALLGIQHLAEGRLRDDAIPGMVAIADVSASTLRGHIAILTAGNAPDATQRDRYLAEAADIVSKITATMTAYEASVQTDEDRANFNKLKQVRATYIEGRNRYIALIQAGKQQEADVFVIKELEPAFVAYRDQTAVTQKYNQDAAVRATGEVIALTSRTVTLTTAISAVSLLGGLIFGGVIIRGVSSILHRISGALAEAAEQVSAAAGQVSASSQSLAEGSSEQAASLEETSSSLEELSSMTKRNAGSAATAKDLSGQTRAAADAGNTDMAAMRQAMDAIKTSSADIAKIIKTIDEIAFQTNILALNAAVEAARAGEAGMGFAVVAEEVRALAQRSAHSAKETAAKIEVAIQNGEHGVMISEKVARSLDVIVGRARQVDELVAEIATASGEQSQGISQINTAVGQMDQITQSNAGNAEETAAAAEELNAQSLSLRDNVAELVRLVGGGRSASAPAAPTRPHRPSSARNSSPGPKSSPTTSAGLHSPALTLAGAGSSQIESGDHFKDL